MDARPLLVLSLFACAALAGCAATAKSDVTDEAQDAIEVAWEAARLKNPEAQLLSVKGTEGEQWVAAGAKHTQNEAKAAAAEKQENDAKDEPASDAAPSEAGTDMTWGDGLTASWEARFLAGGAVLEIEVFADGREPVVTPAPAPVRKGVPADRKVESYGKETHASEPEGPQESDANSWEVGSEEAAQIVGALPEFKQHLEAYPKAGWSYGFVPYSAARPVYDWSQLAMGSGMPELQEIGWAIHGNVWVVSHLDAAAIKAEKVPTVATAVVDASTGKVLMVTVHVPRIPTEILDLSESFQDPIPPSGLEPAVHEVPFTVPVGAVHLVGFLYSFSGVGVGYFGVGIDEARLELVAPSGKVQYTSYGFGYGNDLDIAEPESGAWKLRITHDQPVPQTTQVYAMLYAAVPMYEMMVQR